MSDGVVIHGLRVLTCQLGDVRLAQGLGEAPVFQDDDEDMSPTLRVAGGSGGLRPGLAAAADRGDEQSHQGDAAREGPENGAPGATVRSNADQPGHRRSWSPATKAAVWDRARLPIGLDCSE